MSRTVICIPRISVDITGTFVAEKIKKLQWGSIEHINEIPLFKEPNQKRVVIRIKWNTKENSQKYKKILESGETVKLVYDSCNLPWFWRISKYN